MLWIYYEKSESIFFSFFWIYCKNAYKYINKHFVILYMFVDCIEIGTCDFGVQSSLNKTRTGLCVEPLKYYLDRVPNKEGIIKVNCAISNVNGKCSIYYVDPDIISKMGFPDWFRGCNSINKYHPTVVRVIEERKLKAHQYISSYIVEKKTLYKLLEEQNVEQAFLLKLDTEGHDCVILSKYLDDICGNNNRLPYQIFFECNILTAETVVTSMIERLKDLGYELLQQDDSDAFLRLNLQKLKNKSTFSKPLDKYYIMDYPKGYDFNNHENTLESAMEYCVANNCSGVTFQYGKYEVRGGSYVLFYDDGQPLTSWVYL